MSHNVGEEIAGLYLQIERGCDFVQYNLYTPDVQGEIDVVAVNFTERIVYVCEVAVHLVTGLQYVKSARPDTRDRFLITTQGWKCTFPGICVMKTAGPPSAAPVIEPITRGTRMSLPSSFVSR